MNEHPRARMDTILRQCEAPVKIYSSIGVPASIYRFKWSIIAGQGSTMKKMSKFKFFWGFLYRSRGARGLFQRVQNRSGSLKSTNYANFLKFYFLIIFFLNFFLIWGPRGPLGGPGGARKKKF